jgi:hypothetical protein
MRVGGLPEIRRRSYVKEALVGGSLHPPFPVHIKAIAMKETKAEKLYMLRLWQEKDEEVWRASLKPVGQVEGSVKYFHTLESLVKFLKNLGAFKNSFFE